MRTYGHERLGGSVLRTAGATGFLACVGLVAGMLPLAAWSLLASDPNPHWSLYLAASLAAGAAVGWVLKR